MEELKTLITAGAGLPSLTVWVLVGYLVYKLAVVGSVYGVIRFVAGELFQWLRQHKVEYVEIRPMLDGMSIHTEAPRLVAQIHRLRGKGVGINTDYIYRQSVDWLREAIDAKEALDAAREAGKSK